jgi:uncharacterized protein (DUF927 family)
MTSDHAREPTRAHPTSGAARIIALRPAADTVDENHASLQRARAEDGTRKTRGELSRGRPRRAEWRLLFLSNGEVGLADRLAEAGPGRRASAGQEVRLTDLPADAGAGFGLFEALHGSASGGAFADRLKAGATACYGTAGLAFLRALIDKPEAAREHARKLRADFRLRNMPARAAGQVARVADRVALIAAGGELAIQFGLLRWPAGEAIRGAERCFADWRRARGSDGPAEFTAGIAQVRHFLEVYGEGRFRRLGVQDDAAEREGAERILHPGFRRLTATGTEYFILPEIWRAEVTKGFDAGALAYEMVRRGLIRPDRGDGSLTRVARC